ncbi:hypothetical protein MMC31_008230 [Peltigera leucophlebia]|nr:hypothetical protein [Peltigera leucophlebia]
MAHSRQSSELPMTRHDVSEAGLTVPPAGLGVPRSQTEDIEVRKSIAHFRGSFVGEHNLVPPSSGATLRRHPTIRDRIAPLSEGWRDVGVWKSAFVEMIATGLLCYLSGLIDTSITNFDTTHGAAYVGLSNVFLLTLLIMAAGPGSGGHVNPTITFATMITGLTGLARGVLYLIFQTVGAGVAGGLLRGSFGTVEKSVKYQGGGCFRESGSVTIWQAFVVEIASSFALVFIAFGVGLDPRQQKLFGMFMGPLAVGCAVGLTSFASAGFAPGYTGASMHPGRCFAFAVSRGEFRDQWIWWAGPALGALLFSIAFHIAPPYHSAPIHSHNG